MGVPTILVNSATGSDSAASGAGPGTALTGSAGVSDGAGTVVTLDGSPNLAGVATDGTHVLYFADATAGNRNFSKITGSANSGSPTAQVTVADAFGVTLTKAWAIGGKRASIYSTTSKKLFDNNGGSGDAMPGWIVEMQSAHAETITNPINFWRAGDSTGGPITLRGTAGAGTKPLITFTVDDNGIIGRALGWVFQAFEFQNTAAGKTASTAIASTGGQCVFRQLKISHSTNKFFKGLDLRNGKNFVANCEIGYCASYGITFDQGTITECTILGNYIHDCGGHGIYSGTSGDTLGVLIASNVVTNCTGAGIYVLEPFGGTNRGGWIVGNTLDGNTGSGIEIASTSANLSLAAVLNNICSNNGAYGIKFSGASVTAVVIAGVPCIVDSNDTYNNTSGAYLPTAYGSNDPAVNPSYVGGTDYTPTNTSLRGAALPATIP